MSKDVCIVCGEDADQSGGLKPLCLVHNLELCEVLEDAIRKYLEQKKRDDNIKHQLDLQTNPIRVEIQVRGERARGKSTVVDLILGALEDKGLNIFDVSSKEDKTCDYFIVRGKLKKEKNDA